MANFQYTVNGLFDLSIKLFSNYSVNGMRSVLMITSGLFCDSKQLTFIIRCKIEHKIQITQ